MPFLLMHILNISLKQLQIYLHGNKGKDEVTMLVTAKTGGATPLVIACRNGHYDVAEYLIERCHADIEQPGSGIIYLTVSFLLSKHVACMLFYV